MEAGEAPQAAVVVAPGSRRGGSPAAQTPQLPGRRGRPAGAPHHRRGLPGGSARGQGVLPGAVRAGGCCREHGHATGASLPSLPETRKSDRQAMNQKHAPTSLKISREPGFFVPYCDTMGCLWIGNPHLTEQSSRQEGKDHLAIFKVPLPDDSTEPLMSQRRIPSQDNRRGHQTAAMRGLRRGA